MTTATATVAEITAERRTIMYEDGYQAAYDGAGRGSWPRGLTGPEIDAWWSGWDDYADGDECCPPEEEEEE